MIFIFSIFLSFSAAAQDTLPPFGLGGQNTQVADREEAEIDTVEIWNYLNSPGFHTGETDSTLRWVNLVNLSQRFYERRGAITYRMGTNGRLDGLDYHAYETRHINLELEGLRQNGLINGQADWNRIPLFKLQQMQEQDFGAAYHSEISLKDHYITKPRTYLNYDESKFSYRNLEFVFTQNFSSRLNVELSFWDRRDGGGYNRRSVEGRQIFGRAYYMLTDTWLIKTGYIDTKSDREESFGFTNAFEDPARFPFNRFIATPIEPFANSEVGGRDFYVQMHHRKTEQDPVTSEFGIHLQNDIWDITYSADTLETTLSRRELFARHHLQVNSLKLRGTGRVISQGSGSGSPLTKRSWIGGQSRLDFSLPAEFLSLSGYGKTEVWDDGRSSAEISSKLKFGLFANTSLSVFAGYTSQAPDIQALYWQSNEFSGDENLRNETSLSAGIELEKEIGSFFYTGVRGDYRLNQDAVFLNDTGQFINIDEYNVLSGTGWFGLNSSMFESELSATFKTFESGGNDMTSQLLNTSGDRIWLKGSLYLKSALFDNATFVKTGFSGIFSPNSYRTAQFIPALNRWQHGTSQQFNSSFTRLDFDLSARIRWFMFLIKWENLFDRVNQLGYFETIGHPMPERRLRLSIRVLFTN